MRLLDSNGYLVDWSINPQTGTQKPTENIIYPVLFSDIYTVVIRKYKATANHKFELFSFNHDIMPSVAAGSITSPADASSAVAVGAMHYNKWTTGPIDDSSSRGPTNGGLIKPDITGPSYVSTFSYGSSAFSGTSAAAPHVAGAAALMLSKYPTMTVDQLMAAGSSAAIDMGASGKDNVYGYGRLEMPGAATILYFPHIATIYSWQTEIALVNTGSQTVTGTLKGYSDAGQLVETKAVTLTAHSRKQINIAAEFTNHTGIGYIIFDTTATTVQGYTKFYIDGTYRVAVPVVKEVNISDIYIPHIASTPQWWTGVSLVNTTATAKLLTFTFNTGAIRQVALNPYEHKAFQIESLFSASYEPQPDLQSAVITNAGGVIGLVLFGGLGGNNQLEGLLLTGRTASRVYYSVFTNTAYWWTGIAAYNPSSSSSTITVSPYTVQGTPLSTSTLNIAGKGKYLGAVSNLGLPAQTAWFRIDSTLPLSGFELFGTNDGELLAANAQASGTGANTGVLPKIDKNGWTNIFFINTEAATANVTLTAYNDDGTPVATQVHYIGGYAQMADDPENLFSQSISSATYIAYSADRKIVSFQINGSGDWTMIDGLPGLDATN